MALAAGLSFVGTAAKAVGGPELQLGLDGATACIESWKSNGAETKRPGSIWG
jgi:hypothetical protein